MKKIYSILIILFCVASAKAQNTLTNNDINYKSASYNSSYIVEDTNRLVLNLSTSLANNLQETSRLHFLVYGNLTKLGLGIGAKVNSQFKDFYKTTTAEVLISKKVVISEGHNLNFGLNMGIHFSGVNMNFFNDYVDKSDADIQSFQDKFRFMTGAGLSYTWQRGFKIGFSMPELIKTENKFYPTMFVDASFRQTFLESKKLYLEPAVLFYTTDIVPITFEGTLKVGYQDFAWFKFGGRSTKTILIGAGGGYNFINIGYMYNRNFEDYAMINQSQHNINVYFNFLQTKKKVKQKKI
ncbi:MAG: type IX secretion system membrane protein PorP/SprF [Chitinophagales bacterium]